MKGKALTVSIAAYNMEAYLCQALDSLIDERVIDDLEVFVVDDGSTDRTLEIAQEYAAKYPNSIFAIHKENGGYGTTVNYSIAHATGKYFKLLDADDWFDTEELVKLVAVLRDIQDDLILLPYRHVYESGGEEYVPAVSPGDNIGNGNSFVLDEIERTLGMWAIAYRTEVLKRSGLTLPPHRLYTDSLYCAIPIVCCETARYFDICVYCYRRGREGQSIEPSVRIHHEQDRRLLLEDLFAFYSEANKRKQHNLAYLEHRLEDEYVSNLKPCLLDAISREALERFKEYEKKVRSLSPEISELKHIQGNKLVLFIKLCRKTNYAAYWLLKFVPERFYKHNRRPASGKVKKNLLGGVAGNSSYCPAIACCAGAAA